MIKVKSVVDYLEEIAPPLLQESYDNTGLISGSPEMVVSGILITLDCTESVVEEAIVKKANMIIAHHPIVFKGLKSFTGKNYVERVIIKAIKNDIAIYAIHTNLDNIINGVNKKLAEKLRLTNTRILRPIKNLQKLVTFVPVANTENVLNALHKAGAGNIGNYSECSFKVKGKGYFRPNEEANPIIGEKNIREEVDENRIEVIYPQHLARNIISSLRGAHPYEEVAYYMTDLQNENQENGAGLIGNLSEPMQVAEFLVHLTSSLSLSCIRHSNYSGVIETIALCGGSGAFLLGDALRANADCYVTADVKYHEFFDAEDKLLFCDVGHFESEVGTKELLYDMLTKKFTNFALHLSEVNTNPIKYYK